MTIQTLNQSQLAEYIQSAGYRSQPAIPIGYHRALSHIANPRVGENDVLLIIAKNKTKMLGYLGVIPGHFQHPDGRKQEIGEMSCMWVDTAARGQGIAVKLLVKAGELYNGLLVATDYVPGTKKIYNRSGGFHLEPYTLPGLRLYVQSNLTRILPPKKPLFVKLKPILKYIDHFINFISNFDINKSSKFSHPQNIRIQTPDELNEADYSFIKPQQQGEVFARDLKTFNWMLRYPWILESPTVDSLHQKYYFSSFEKLKFVVFPSFPMVTFSISKSRTSKIILSEPVFSIVQLATPESTFLSKSTFRLRSRCLVLASCILPKLCGSTGCGSDKIEVGLHDQNDTITINKKNNGWVTLLMGKI